MTRVTHSSRFLLGQPKTRIKLNSYGYTIDLVILPQDLVKVRKSRFRELSSRSQRESFRKCAFLIFLIALSSNLLVTSSPYEHVKIMESQKESSYLFIPRAEATELDDLVIGWGEELTLEYQALTPMGDIVVEEGGRAFWGQSLNRIHWRGDH